MKTIAAALSFLLLTTFAWSQTDQKPTVNAAHLQGVEILSAPANQEMPLTLEALPFQADMDFAPTLQKIKTLNGEVGDIHRFKKDHAGEKGRRQTAEENLVYDMAGERTTDFEIGTSFFGDLDGGCPNDNTIAVSKSGKIISMMNGAVGIYNTAGQKQNIYDLGSFFNYHIGDPCDPKVEYDPAQDRFFMFVQACGNYQDKVAFGFSKTNDPNGAWFIYVFPSDALGDGSWSDYPKVAVTSKEIFVSLNLFEQAGEGKYRQSIIYQLDKMDGYSGQSLTYRIWDGLMGTQLLVRSGINQYGPGVYVVSTNAGGGNSFQLHDITGNLDDNSAQLKSYTIPVTPYEVPLSANQAGSNQRLDTGDARGLDAFYQNGIIHFVHTVSDQGYAAIRYHRLNPAQPDGNNFRTTTDSGNKDYAYASIAPFSASPTDQTAIVHFAASGTNQTPEMRAKVYQHDFSTSASKQIFAGSGPCTTCYDINREYNRWGDYSAVAYQYNTGGVTVWVAGSTASSSRQEWWTYIAELNARGGTTSVEETSLITGTNVMPNPAIDRFSVVLESGEKVGARFELWNTAGTKVSDLYEGALFPGRNKFSFDCSRLEGGLYFLIVKNQHHEVLTSHKIFVAR